MNKQTVYQVWIRYPDQSHKIGVEYESREEAAEFVERERKNLKIEHPDALYMYISKYSYYIDDSPQSETEAFEELWARYANEFDWDNDERIKEVCRVFWDTGANRG